MTTLKGRLIEYNLKKKNCIKSIEEFLQQRRKTDSDSYNRHNIYYWLLYDPFDNARWRSDRIYRAALDVERSDT